MQIIQLISRILTERGIPHTHYHHLSMIHLSMIHNSNIVIEEQQSINKIWAIMITSPDQTTLTLQKITHAYFHVNYRESVIPRTIVETVSLADPNLFDRIEELCQHAPLQSPENSTTTAADPPVSAISSPPP